MVHLPKNRQGVPFEELKICKGSIASNQGFSASFENLATIFLTRVKIGLLNQEKAVFQPASCLIGKKAKGLIS